MTIYYSESTKGFYDTDLHDKAQIPDNAIELSHEDHFRILEEQSHGKVITVVNGVVTTKDPVLTEAQLSNIERQWRNTELSRADIELNKVQDGMGVCTVAAWREYRCALRVLPQHPAFPSISARPVAPDAV